MQDKELSELIIEVSNALNLHPAIVEKDWHVTRVIAALSELPSDAFTLVFSGGTALAKAHRLVNRMSEDIDFKIVLTPANQKLSTSALRKKLSELRQRIYQALLNHGFACKAEDIRARNNNHYMHINLPYRTTSVVSHYLRSAIKLELTVSTLQMPTTLLPIHTLVADAIGNQAEFPQAQVPCISVMETAAEKWVALLRRTAMAARGYLRLDHALIRHLYDLHHIVTANKLNDTFKILIAPIIKTDQEQFKQQYPEFFDQPWLEIQHGLRLVAQDINLKKDWETFIAAMVFDKAAPSYQQAYASLEAICQSILSDVDVSLISG